jgi:hypothetical protein
MTLHTVTPTVRARIGKALAAALRRFGTAEAAPAQVRTTIDHWIAEEQWLAGLPGHRNEHFARLWYCGP